MHGPPPLCIFVEWKIPVQTSCACNLCHALKLRKGWTALQCLSRPRRCLRQRPGPHQDTRAARKNAGVRRWGKSGLSQGMTLHAPLTEDFHGPQILHLSLKNEKLAAAHPNSPCIFPQEDSGSVDPEGALFSIGEIGGSFPRPPSDLQFPEEKEPQGVC